MTILGFFINRSKKLDVVESSGRCRWKEEAVVGRFKQESIYEPSTGTSFIDQACSVKKAVYWRSSFWRFHWPRIRLGQLKRKTEWPISSHLDRTSMVNNAYVNFSKTTKCTRRPQDRPTGSFTFVTRAYLSYLFHIAFEIMLLPDT